MRLLQVFCICILSCTFSCGTKNKNSVAGQSSIRINLGEDPRTLDPRKSRTLVERNLAGMLFDGLTRTGKLGKTELSVAQDVVIDGDGLGYTFTLKEAKWSNGDKLVASDFIHSWETSLAKDFPAENAYQLYCIKNAKEIKEGKKDPSELGAIAINEKTLRINLETPVPYLLELLSFPIFFPVHSKIDTGEKISCGPFVLKEWKHNNFIEVVKNENYFDANETRLSSVYMVMVSDETELRMFENKELDRAGSPLSVIPWGRLASLKKEKKLQSADFLGTRFFRVNVEKGPLSNPNIRKALAAAIDRTSLVEHVIQGDQKIALQFLPNSPNTYFKDRDIEKAKEYFEAGLLELGLTSSRFPKITILSTPTQQDKILTQAIREDWRKILGIEVSIEVNETKVYFSRVRNLEYDIALGSWIADYDDPENFLDVFKYKKDSVNNTGWESTEYISALNLTKTMFGQEREKKLFFCESILMEGLPLIPLYHLKIHYLQNPSLKNVVVSSTGNIDFKWAYMDSSE